VAASNAVFVMAYSNIALSPDGGASWSLQRALPRQLANELLLCGERIDAQRLQALGLVNRIAEPGNALAQALEFAEMLNQRAPNALASIKELLNDADGSSLNKQLARERDQFVQNLHHTNAGIGIAAFLGKTRPDYS
jgi:enoyl-CoA hydratase/carnithine racemase